jgi:hypothetical protein
MHNTLATFLKGFGGLIITTIFDWSGWFLMFLIVLWAISYEQRRLRVHLREEVRIGLITKKQYHTACSAWSQGIARLSALIDGNYRDTARFYQVCAELAHKKFQRANLGDEGGNTEIIYNFRSELKQLAPKVKA